MSVVEQSRPVDEIIVADDASTDGSRELIKALSHTYTNIKPILRDRNIGVAANRDLAIREARGDFITYLDGDDRYLPTKIEAEVRALGDRAAEAIAYSDFRVVNRQSRRVRTNEIGDFARLDASNRFRWVLKRRRQPPREMLIPKQAHLMIGGYNHSLRTYEDWDYTLRLAATPLNWVHSGTVGSIHNLRGGLSRQGAMEHLLDELRVMGLNRGLARRHVGTSALLWAAARTIGFRARWGIQNWHRRRKGTETKEGIR
jgi:glycosyltransferase involved in cell wall biosynthesis